MRYFKLEGRKVVPCVDSMVEWFAWFGHLPLQARRVGYDDVDGNEVSTVFMGIDTSPGESGVPRGVFETKIDLASGEGAVVTKYSSWDDAERGHVALVAALRQALDAKVQVEALLERLRQVRG